MSDGVAVLIFGAMLVAVQASVMIFRGKGWGPLSTKLVSLTIVVVALLFLAVSTMSVERLSAAYALLGAIAGYIFGKQEKPEN